jgi:cell shape-determining protein MreC
MFHRNSLFLVILIVILICFVLFAPSYGWQLRGWLNPNNSAQGNAENLVAQNQSLEAALAKLSVVESELPQAPSHSIRAMVYSRYPLNFRNEILVDAGSDEGVAVGKAVMFQGVFIGTVQAVFPESAVVLTIFDVRFKLPVRIGASGADALLQGGTYPQAVSIAEDANVKAGDIVYTAAPGIPYALPIGMIAAASVAPNNLFQQASLNLAYDINDVQTVEIEQ